MSSVFAARSLNHGRAITGTRWLAEMWPLCEFTSSSDMIAVLDDTLQCGYRWCMESESGEGVEQPNGGGRLGVGDLVDVGKANLSYGAATLRGARDAEVSRR